jgi:hypothetical protein
MINAKFLSLFEYQLAASLEDLWPQIYWEIGAKFSSHLLEKVSFSGLLRESVFFHATERKEWAVITKL